MSEPLGIGWDLGGAHLKAALADGDGRLRDVVQLACPLWRDLDRLEQGVREVLERWPQARCHAITMTGELADVFSSRKQGVTAIAAAMLARLPAGSARLLAGRRGLVPADDFAGQELAIASANWLASASFACHRVPSGVLVDIGSTTVDVVPFADGEVRARGDTDGERLAADELLYTGVVRTPVCALLDRAPFAGEWQTLAAEVFATSADVYRLLGVLPDDADLMQTADGRGTSVAESAARLARMLGRDADEAPPTAWRALAGHVAREQRRRITRAVERVLSAPGIGPEAVLVGAGVGRFLLDDIGRDLGRESIDFANLCNAVSEPVAQRASDCAPAAALALLALTRAA